jgi:hypothetical protein
MHINKIVKVWELHWFCSESAAEGLLKKESADGITHHFGGFFHDSYFRQPKGKQEFTPAVLESHS